jgi:hypothetical protein
MPAVSGVGLKAQAERVARAAYFRAQQRGIEPGLELEDRLAAERDIERQGR